jgi:RecA-family ATPase
LELKDDKPQIKLYKGKSYVALPRDPQPWLIEKIVPSGGAMNIYGKPKLGKSYGALGIAFAVADEKATEWLGYKVIKHGPVVYLQVDTPRSEWADRIERLSGVHDIENVYFTDLNLVPYPFNINQQDVKEALMEVLTPIKPVLLVVDTLREVHEGDENDSTAMKKVISSLVECTMKSNTSLLLVSHSRKDQVERGEDLMNDGRGSSYVAGRMDIVAKLTEKYLTVQGRSIGHTKIGIEQVPMGRPDGGMIVLNGEKAENEANLKYVLAQPDLSDAARARLLAAMDGKIEPETARSRIRDYKKRHGLLGGAEGGGD